MSNLEENFSILLDILSAILWARHSAIYLVILSAIHPKKGHMYTVSHTWKQKLNTTSCHTYSHTLSYTLSHTFSNTFSHTLIYTLHHTLSHTLSYTLSLLYVILVAILSAIQMFFRFSTMTPPIWAKSKLSMLYNLEWNKKMCDFP